MANLVLDVRMLLGDGWQPYGPMIIESWKEDDTSESIYIQPMTMAGES